MILNVKISNRKKLRNGKSSLFCFVYQIAKMVWEDSKWLHILLECCAIKKICGRTPKDNNKQFSFLNKNAYMFAHPYTFMCRYFSKYRYVRRTGTREWSYEIELISTINQWNNTQKNAEYKRSSFVFLYVGRKNNFLIRWYSWDHCPFANFFCRFMMKIFFFCMWYFPVKHNM